MGIKLIKKERLTKREKGLKNMHLKGKRDQVVGRYESRVSSEEHKDAAVNRPANFHIIDNSTDCICQNSYKMFFSCKKEGRTKQEARKLRVYF
jgi:hypothetical protein